MDILKNIQVKLLELEGRYGVPPNYIKLGIEVFNEIAKKYEVNITFQTKNCTLFGIKVDVDYNNERAVMVGYLEEVVPELYE